MLIASALVLLMTPGLAIFYGGLVRSKNVLSVIMHSFACMGIVSVIWVLFGYSVAFGPDWGGVLGRLDYAMLRGVGLEAGPYAPQIPHVLFCAFQLMFAMITPALITGAFAERMRFWPFFWFTVLWSSLVYLPVCHWVWGGGWIQKLGVLDFDGGTVIHVNSGVAALVSSWFIGKRLGWRHEQFHPNNLPITLLGAGLLWFGWFGFNAGSALSASPLAALAFFNTQIAAATAALSWILAEAFHRGKPTTLGIVSGALAGLVAITPAAGFVGPIPSLLIGLIAGSLCYTGVFVKFRGGYDDALDVVGIHGVGGVWGGLATGLFAAKYWNPAGVDGLLFGNIPQVVIQGLGLVVTVTYSLLVTFLILWLLDRLFGLRVAPEAELGGLDLAEHLETAYKLQE
jgi:Amt family ammonium transporter